MRSFLSAHSRSAIEAAALAAGGAAAGISFWPGKFGWIAWFAFVPLFMAVSGKSVSGAFRRGWLFGAAVWAAGIYWLVPPLSDFLGVRQSAAMLAFLGLCVWHGLMFAVMAAAAAAGTERLSARLGWRETTALICTAAPAMAVMESFFPMLFPVRFAETQSFHLPLVQICGITGPAGPLWLLLGFNAALCGLLKAYRSRTAGRSGMRAAAAVLGAVCLLLALSEIYGFARMRRTDEAAARALARGRYLDVAIIQGSVPVDAPHEDINRRALLLYRELTREAAEGRAPDLVIWPESVYGRTARWTAHGEGNKASFTPDFRAVLSADIPEKLTLLMGSKAELRHASGGSPEPEPRRFNAAYAAGPDKQLLGFTLKLNLFPFGEFMPLGRYFPWLYRLSPGTDRLSSGVRPETIEVKGARLGVLICYEDLLTLTAGRFIRRGADILVAISNEIGFGGGPATRQHLMLSSLRAVETGRFFLRAANTGVSAVIDPCGRVLRSLPSGERGYINARIPLSGGSTFYSRHPFFFLAAGLLVPVFFLALSSVKARGPSGRG